MMQHIGERYHIKAFVFYRIQLVDFVAVKHKIEVVKIEHVAGHDVRVEIVSVARCRFLSRVSKVSQDRESP